MVPVCLLIVALPAWCPLSIVSTEPPTVARPNRSSGICGIYRPLVAPSPRFRCALLEVGTSLLAAVSPADEQNEGISDYAKGSERGNGDGQRMAAMQRREMRCL